MKPEGEGKKGEGEEDEKDPIVWRKNTEIKQVFLFMTRVAVRNLAYIANFRYKKRGREKGEGGKDRRNKEIKQIFSFHDSTSGGEKQVVLVK